MADNHNHAGCQHHNAGSMSGGKLKFSLVFTLAFVVIEAIVGLRSGSLALVSDAGHNFTDALALALSWYALTAARKPANAARTYGYHRVGILTALFNALTLWVIAAGIFYEAFHLFLRPQHVASLPMIGVALIALLMNTVIASLLHADAAHDINARSAFIHMMGDALSSAGVVLAGIVIHFTGWVYADPLVSVAIGAFIVYSSWGIVVEAVNILLEGTPRGMDIGGMAAAVQGVPGVSGLHDLHVWTIANGMHALSCHLHIQEENLPRAAQIVREVKSLFATQYGIDHSTIETECGDCQMDALYCQLDGRIETDHDHSAHSDHVHA